MSAGGLDRVFGGSIPLIYERYLVPLIFEPYAGKMAALAAADCPGRVLEVACGTGVLTRALARALPEDTSILATDLNQPMLDHAASLEIARPVKWRQADAMKLPFEDCSFDAVVCQFGVMFFPGKVKAFSEARRVLKPGGVYLFSVWDSIEENEFADSVTNGVAALFPEDPPRFLARTPHGYSDKGKISKDLSDGGFDFAPEIDTLAARSRAESPRDPSIAYCQGTPLRNEIEARDASRLEEATDAGAAEVTRRFGSGAVDGKIQAQIVRVPA